MSGGALAEGDRSSWRQPWTPLAPPSGRPWPTTSPRWGSGVWVATDSWPCDDAHGGGSRMNHLERSARNRVEGRVDEPADDQQLIARLAAGDTTALEALYDRHARVTLAVILRIVADRQVAEDLLQEALFRVWQHAGAYDGSLGGVRPWLLAIAHNLALNELRRRRRHPQDAFPAQPADDWHLAAIADPAPDPADTAWDSARRARLTHALDELPAPQREIIALYAVGHSQSEIASRLDQPLGTVKSRMRRGLLHLREILHRDGYDLE